MLSFYRQLMACCLPNSPTLWYGCPFRQILLIRPFFREYRQGKDSINHLSALIAFDIKRVGDRYSVHIPSLACIHDAARNTRLLYVTSARAQLLFPCIGASIRLFQRTAVLECARVARFNASL